MTNNAILLTAETRVAVLRTLGLTGFVGIHGVGTPIPDKETEDIKMASGIVRLAEGIPEQRRENLRNYTRELMQSGAAFEEEPSRVLS
jgi:transcription antitermination factor NusG